MREGLESDKARPQVAVVVAEELEDREFVGGGVAGSGACLKRRWLVVVVGGVGIGDLNLDFEDVVVTFFFFCFASRWLGC